jgi:hypothetical protein
MTDTDTGSSVVSATPDPEAENPLCLHRAVARGRHADETMACLPSLMEIEWLAAARVLAH